ncbi:t-SNARE [Mycena floridula]|nr:t-SNARE [Mycena floridula]
MATDPYHAVQQEIQTSLQAASQTLASFARIRHMAVREDNEELVWARNELKATLASLEADLEDLEESVKIVESTDARMFGLDDAEVQNRRRYVEHVRTEIQNMRGQVSPNSNPPSQNAPRYPSRGAMSPPAYEDEDHQEAWAREEQQMIIQQQDRTLDSIAGTLSTLAQQAGLMGQEVAEHNEMLDDLEQGVDRTDSKLGDAMRRMRKFMRQTEAEKSGYCIIFLIIVLMVLLLVVILI